MTKNLLTESKANFQQILENMVDGLFTVDKNCVITYWNKAAEDIFGYKKKE